MDRLTSVLTLLSALGAALLAGNFFAFSAFVLKALGGLSAERGIVAMQAVTLAIKGPVFLGLFFGTAALCAGLGGLALLNWAAPGSPYLLAGALFFLIGTFAVTVMRNVPLNRQLAAASPDAREGHDLWRGFQSSWAFWNHVRTVAAALACASFILALTEIGNPFEV